MADEDQMFALGDGQLANLESRLASAARSEGLVDVVYRRLDSPVGRLLAVATDRGLLRVAFELEGFDTVLESVAERVSPRLLEAPGQLDDVAREMEEYFTGERRSFDLPIDDSMSSGFRLLVQRFLTSIDYGQTLSYGQVAELVGNPKAVRAVGTACATNPLPVVVPCHRVLRSDGSLGGYLGGLAAKKVLLNLERRS